MFRANAQNSTYWYVDGQQNNFYLRTDIFAFKCLNGLQYSGFIDTNIVEKFDYYGDRFDNANEIHFKSTSSYFDRLNFLTTISSSSQLEKPYLIICKDTSLSIKENKWYIIDDQILVNFIQPNPDSNFINTFIFNNGLDLIYAPPNSLNYNINNKYSYTYIFRINERFLNINSVDYYIKTARDIYTNNIGIVQNATPNITNFRNEYNLKKNEDTENENEAKVECATNDNRWNRSWHLDKQGFQYSSEPPGTPGADIDICGCWDANLNGSNIKVAIIGYGEINLNNLEFSSNTFLNDKWDCSTGNCNNNLSNNNTGSSSLGTMACIISATKNNNLHIAGIADKVKIIPIKIGNQFTSYSSLIPTFQKAADEKVDIIVTDYFS